MKERIQILINKKEWSQRKLALASGVSPEYINRIMKGVAKNVSPRISGMLAKALDVSENFLQYGTEGRVSELEIFARMPKRDHLTEKGKMLFEMLSNEKKKHVITIMEDILGGASPPYEDEKPNIETFKEASTDVKKRGHIRR